MAILGNAPGPFPYHWQVTGSTPHGHTFQGLFPAKTSKAARHSSGVYTFGSPISNNDALFHIKGDNKDLKDSVTFLNSIKVAGSTRDRINQIVQITNDINRQAATEELFSELYSSLDLEGIQGKLYRLNHLRISVKTHLEIAGLFRQQLNSPDLASILDFSAYREQLIKLLIPPNYNTNPAENRRVKLAIETLINMIDLGLTTEAELGIKLPELQDLWRSHHYQLWPAQAAAITSKAPDISAFYPIKDLDKAVSK